MKISGNWPKAFNSVKIAYYREILGNNA